MDKQWLGVIGALILYVIGVGIGIMVNIRRKTKEREW